MHARHQRIAFLVVAGLLGACHADPPATQESVAYAIEPHPYDRSLFRTFEIVSGTLTLDSANEERGTFQIVLTTRMTETGKPPVDEVTRSRGRYARDEGTLRIEFENGACETFRVEDGGQTLQTINNKVPCRAQGGGMSVQRINTWRRVAARVDVEHLQVRSSMRCDRVVEQAAKRANPREYGTAECDGSEAHA